MSRRGYPRNHFLGTPIYVSLIRIFQFVFAIILLGLSAYGVSKNYYDGFGLTLFMAISTMIITVYILAATEFVPLIYNYWALLSLDTFLALFWLIAFSLTASNASNYNSYYRYIDGYYNWNIYTYRDALRVCAIFGAFEFVMALVTLAFTGVYLLRHKADGGHSIPMPRGIVSENVEMKRGPIQPSRQVQPDSVGGVSPI